MFWTLLVVLKSDELAFSVFFESVSRDASNKRINSLYSCRKYKTGICVASEFELSRCSLISVTKWRVYLPFPIWHAFCHVKFLGHVQLKSIGCQSTCTILGSTCAQSHSFGIRKGILHTWLRSCLAGLRAWVVIDAASRPIVARSWILDGSLLYVYIVGGGPCDTACVQARLIPRCKNENRMSLL